MTRPFPLVTAHSGCMGSPENGREHIERALAAGADIVELDIRLSGDGRVVLSHDDCVERADGRRLIIRERRADELRAAALAAGAELLELDEAFDLLAAAGVVLNLDAKEPEAA
ncbi:MAG: glycerophosphodiester phosphodiesterase family protein, partial [Spirochaetaceae bacterium]|nr:glycerophosphodiester phosphodiesterase family protein [Spirochaetaceae bacterium]